LTFLQSVRRIYIRVDISTAMLLVEMALSYTTFAVPSTRTCNACLFRERKRKLFLGERKKKKPFGPILIQVQDWGL
jgi:hypothetical protein